MATPARSGAEDGEQRGLADELTDVLLYAPVGLLISIGEEIPKLVEKGRARVEGRVIVARAVGQFAVAIGRRKAEDFWRQRTSARVAEEQPGAAPGGESESVPNAPAAGAAQESAVEPARPPARKSRPAATALAIPGYDSLAASQVVQRLEGLSPGELEEVRAYEEATRGRRTILGRISQLSTVAES